MNTIQDDEHGAQMLDMMDVTQDADNLVESHLDRATCLLMLRSTRW